MNDQKLSEKEETGCCPKFNPEPWDGKIHQWQDKRFIKGKVRTFMYIPINFGSVMTKMVKMIENAGGQIPDNLGLSDHTSKWKMDLYLAVPKE